MRTITPRVALPLAAALAVGLLAGCGGSSGATSSSSSSSPVASDSSSATPSATESSESSSAAPATAAADCLVGTWETDVSGLTEQMKAVMGPELGDSEIVSTGTLDTTFDGTTATAAYHAFTLTFNVTIEETPMVMTMGFDGTASATYSTSGDQLALGQMDMSGVAVTYTATVGDQVMDMSDALGDSMSGLGTTAGTTSAYTCDATTLTTTTTEEGAQVTQTYHRK